METWKTNLDETKKRYIDWWNHKGIILNMWEMCIRDSHKQKPWPKQARKKKHLKKEDANRVVRK